MKTNIDIIQDVIDYIEEHQDQSLSLEEVAGQVRYSLYHLHKLFTSIVKIPIRAYIVRRRLTEAACLLVTSEQPILQIAQQVEYQSQQGFTKTFKVSFRHSPKIYHQRKQFVLLQDKITLQPYYTNSLENLIQIQQLHKEACLFVGTRMNTRFGFFKIGSIWRTLHAKK